MKHTINKVASVGLALGGIFGMVGTFVTDPGLRGIAWGIDSLGLVGACVLLGLKYFRRTRDFVAAGFLIFAIGEAVMLSGMSAGLMGSTPSFAAGTALWALALLFISLPKEFPHPVRLVGMLTAVLFAATAFNTFDARPLPPTARPLPYYAYPFLVITFLGWIWELLSEA